MLKTNLLLVASIAFSLNSCIEEKCEPTIVKEKVQKSNEITLRFSPQNSTCFNVSTNSPNSKSPDNRIMRGYGWTINGTPTYGRTFFQIDLSDIPDGAVITSAKLSLYQYERTEENGFTIRSTANDVVLSRVTESFDSTSISWNNAPATSSTQMITIKGTNSLSTEYLNLDITKILTHENGNLLDNYGFGIKLKEEDYYNILSFGSGYCPDVTKRPELTINYTTFE